MFFVYYGCAPLHFSMKLNYSKKKNHSSMYNVDVLEVNNRTYNGVKFSILQHKSLFLRSL